MPITHGYNWILLWSSLLGVLFTLDKTRGMVLYNIYIKIRKKCLFLPFSQPINVRNGVLFFL